MGLCVCSINQFYESGQTFEGQMFASGNIYCLAYFMTKFACVPNHLSDIYERCDVLVVSGE